MKKLLIYGANFVDVVKLVNSINTSIPTWEIVGFIDDDENLRGKSILEYPVIGGFEEIPNLLEKYPDVHIFNNVNVSLDVKKKITARIEQYTDNIPSLVHPGTNLESVTYGKGVFIPDGCILGSRTQIGNYVTFRYSATVSHDVKVGDYVFVGPGSVTTGKAILEEGCYLGACCCVINGVTIGKESVVGASALVNKDVPPGITVAGIPAKELKK